jgi:probable HAF family extracellular repeat protein
MSYGPARIRWLSRLVIGLVTAGLLVVAPESASAAKPWRVVDIGAGDDSVANAINQRGHVVGQRQGRAFLWRDGRFINLGDLGGGYSLAADINNQDEVVGHSAVASGANHAYVWRAGTMTDLGVLPGGDNSFASAINDAGVIVGWSATASDNFRLRAVRWFGGVMTNLGGRLPGADSVATDVNNHGVVVGTSNNVPVRWSGREVEGLTEQPASATAVNDRGDVAGMAFFSGLLDGFLWQRGRLTELLPPPGSSVFQPYGINKLRQVVGHSEYNAVLWHRGRTTILPSLVSTAAAYDINDAGQIVGTSATRLDGFAPHAVLWTR